MSLFPRIIEIERGDVGQFGIRIEDVGKYAVVINGKIEVCLSFRAAERLWKEEGGLV